MIRKFETDTHLIFRHTNSGILSIPAMQHHGTPGKLPHKLPRYPAAAPHADPDEKTGPAIKDTKKDTPSLYTAGNLSLRPARWIFVIQ